MVISGQMQKAVDEQPLNLAAIANAKLSGLLPSGLDRDYEVTQRW